MLRSFAVRLVLVLSPVVAWGQSYTISTIAGNGTAGFADGAAIGTAQFNQPSSIWRAPSGAIYIADTLNFRVRMLSGGNVTTIAGTGFPAYGGDGAAASSAGLNNPAGVTGDSSGNLYISDTGNFVIRKITSGGTISTYAGNYSFGSGFNGDNIQATSASLGNPFGLALDSSGNLYIADAGSTTVVAPPLIRRVTASNGLIGTAVGSTGPTLGKLNHPTSVAFDPAGNLYIANQGNSKILKFTVATGALSTFAGATSGFAGDGGQASLSAISNAAGVAVDSAGNVYIADTVNHRIRKVAADTGIITTIAGAGKPGYSGDGGPALNAQLNSPKSLVVDNAGNVYFADTSNNVIRVLQPSSLPAVNSGGVANAASFQPQVSPGALASVFGSGFGLNNISPAPNPAYPTLAGGVSVSVNGNNAPLYYVSPGQINFQVPWETAVGPATIAVTVNGGTSNTVSVPVVSAGPGLFTSNGAAIVQNYPDYSLNGPSHPAAAGGTIIAYLTGSGPVSPAVATGAVAPASPLAVSTSLYSATIGSAAATVSFLGLSPGYLGLVQANIVIPSGLASGTYPLTVTIGGQTSNAGSITVK